MNKSRIAIINGRLFMNNRFVIGNIIIEGDKIKKIIPGKLKKYDLSHHYVIDASACYVSYGFFDPHVHFRCPGNENKEDWFSGARAAIKGGYTFVIDMPNNHPPADNDEILELKNDLARETPLNFGFYLGLSKDNYKRLSQIIYQCRIKNIPLYGIKVFLGSSTGNLLVEDQEIIKKSLKTNLINLFHCEDQETLEQFSHLKNKTIIDHEKRRPVVAELNGLRKIIKAAKAMRFKAKIYICHISSNNTVKLIKKYRKKGFNIFTEITPHHLFFYLEAIKKSNIYKVNPPLRPISEVAALRKGFNRGDFHVIGTDHAPHLVQEKKSDQAPAGLPGLESSFYALYSLYEDKILSLKRIFRGLTNGYRLFKIKKRGQLKKGYFADITIIRKENHIFKAEKTATKADFSPYDNLETNCMIDTVIINGKIYLKNGELIKWN